MGYYVRAFCTSNRIPTIRELLQWSRQQGYNLSLDNDSQEVNIDSDTWEAAGFIYKEGKLSFLSEVNRDLGNEDCLMRKEIEEFKELLGDVGFFDLKKKKILKHLANTKYIIANQIPVSDFDDTGYEANAVFLNYFVKNCGGMVQADGEGFYEGDKLILALE